jgi:hypothetical protein
VALIGRVVLNLFTILLPAFFQVAEFREFWSEQLYLDMPILESFKPSRHIETFIRSPEPKGSFEVA